MSTKYPIILVHGIIVKNFKSFRAFGKIEKKLIEKGYKVYSSQTDAFGTIENNAMQLKEQIEKILLLEKADKINIIAHSKGGLDSKYMIEFLNMEDKVASLTTLCTPHRGSIIATKLLKLPKFLLKYIAFWINLWYKILGDKKPNSLEVCKQLSKKEIETDTLTISNKIYCQSYSSSLKKTKDDFIMGIPLLVSRYYEKDMETDGLVSNESSKFGEYQGVCIEDSISHKDIIDITLSKTKREKVYAFYLNLCTDLKNKGY